MQHCYHKTHIYKQIHYSDICQHVRFRPGSLAHDRFLEYAKCQSCQLRKKPLLNINTVKQHLLWNAFAYIRGSNLLFFILLTLSKQPNLRIQNPQYFLLFKWKFDNFFIHIEFDRGNKKTKCIHKSNVIKKIVVNIGDSEFVNLVFRWREQDNCPPLACK